MQNLRGAMHDEKTRRWRGAHLKGSPSSLQRDAYTAMVFVRFMTEPVLKPHTAKGQHLEGMSAYGGLVSILYGRPPIPSFACVLGCARCKAAAQLQCTAQHMQH